MASSISTCFFSHKYPILKPVLLSRSPIHHCHSQCVSNIRVRVSAIRAGFDVPAGPIRVGRGVEMDRLPSVVRDQVMSAVDSYGGRVTIGDVASRAGLKLDLAERALQALAADTEGFLEVSDEGDVLYVFPRDYRSKLAGKSFRMKVEPLLDKLKAGAEYLIRVSFGTALASIVIVYTAIIALISSRSDEDNRGRRGGRSFDSGFTVFFRPSDLFWYWDPYYYRRQQTRSNDGMNFVESVFSFVFGDGDPNQGLEEERWKLIGQYISSNGGVVAAEELAPYLDVKPMEETMGFEFDRKMENNYRAEKSLAGCNKALEALRELIIYPFLYAKESQKLGLKWPRGLLLYGPPGTGKTSLVQAVVRECNAHLTMINPYSVHRAHAGESEKFLREAFSEAYSHASLGKPSVIFIDEIDAICPRRNSRKEQEARIVGQLLTLMDGNRTTSKALPHVVVLASTNRVDGIDPALRRPGRFDSEIEVSVPTVEERLQILELHSKNLHLDHDVDLESIAALCNGYVGADLEALCREAARIAYRRVSDTAQECNMITLRMSDWNGARAEVGPSITRGTTKEFTKVTWDEIGGLKDLKKKLQQAVEWPIKHADAFARLGISPVRGVLLHGPPGCSKTTLAKAAAHAAQASFFSLSGAELYSKYVGEGEALLRRTFQKARLAAPSIVFFDEADAIAPKRSDGGDSSGNLTVGERLLSTLLTEMDGLEQATGIIVLAATNRPQAIDAALMRPGRFDLVLYVPPPDTEGRYEILRIHTRKMRLGEDVDLMQVAECTDLFTGADLEGLCREAGMAALREDISAESVYDRHFQVARDSLRPSLTRSMIEEYSCKVKSRRLSSSR